ncbi:hypothetical protein CHS0354_014917 [Potamilus streckersoni]|uniref:Major facilitator superfamily domain-containing protein 12 n=1 Tax=Potamilus streckersoni TaxID=2493646 RepID=A0AAE0W1P1_9BIVA|nr:hypothetical protein CHS0354_014917 [Potamilus streckersoni]
MANIYKEGLNFRQRLAYSVGHVLNDLTASMWFSYLIIYLHQVKNFDNNLSGDLVMIGQVSDAIFTPFVGYESDRVKGLWKMGKRKTWHFIGTICVVCSFPFLFVDCITCSNAPDYAQFIYFVPFVVIFQFGWASVQISHLSLIPDLTPDEGQRVGLNGMRYAFTVLSNMAVYGIAWVLLAVNTSNTSGPDNMLSAADTNKFRVLVLIVVGIGIFFSLIFYAGVKEHERVDDEMQSNSHINNSDALDSIERSFIKHQIMTWKCWLKEHQFYQIAVIYMCTRLYVNLSQVYLPMYLTETLKIDKESIAIIPLIVYVSGFLTSLFMRLINKLAGRKFTYFMGILIGISASVWFYFIPQGSKQVYGAAVLLGAGGSTLLVTSLAMTSDLISMNTESGAFVYGAMSFTDKLSNGVAVVLIQQFHPCT